MFSPFSLFVVPLPGMGVSLKVAGFRAVSGHRKDIYAQNQRKNHEIAHEGLQQPVLRYLSIRDTNPGPCQGPMDGGFAIGSYDMVFERIKLAAFPG